MPSDGAISDDDLHLSEIQMLLEEIGMYDIDLCRWSVGFGILSAKSSPWRLAVSQGLYALYSYTPSQSEYDCEYERVILHFERICWVRARGGSEYSQLRHTRAPPCRHE